MTGVEIDPRVAVRRRRFFTVLTAVALLGGVYATFIATQSPLEPHVFDVEGSSTMDERGYLVGYRPYGTVTLRLFLENTGLMPVHLDGITAPFVPTSDPENQFVGPFYEAEPLLYNGEQPGAFHPVDIAPGASVSVGLRLTMCPSGTIGSDGGAKTRHEVQLHYQYAGWERTYTETFSPALVAVFSYDCGFDGKHGLD